MTRAFISATYRIGVPPEAIYFVTWRIAARRRSLLPPQRALISSALHHFDGQRYDLLAYVVMDDHVHVLIAPRRIRLERIVHSWKSFAAHAIGGGRLWQPECQDRIVRDAEELVRVARYIVENPTRRWPGARTYPFAWVSPDIRA